MAIQTLIQKKAVYIYLIIICALCFDFVKDNVVKGYYIFCDSSNVVDAYVVNNEKRETTEKTAVSTPPFFYALNLLNTYNLLLHLHLLLHQQRM
jgi:hypothetical protein